MARSVMITGASGDVGVAAAVRLARGGFDVFATVRSQEKAEKLRAVAAEHEVRVRTMVLDVTDAQSCTTALAAIARQTDGGPWGLVNNAGIITAGAIEDVPEETARLLWETNVVAPARLARLVLPAMRRRGDGRIVNVSSIAGRSVFPALGWYSASKAALSSVNHALRMETSDSGVRVVLVEPSGHGRAMVEHAAQALQALPTANTSVHRASYRAAAQAMHCAPPLPGADAIARAVARALTSRRPHARYLVGAQARCAAFSEPVLPSFLVDRVKEVASMGRSTNRMLEYLVRRWCTPW
ncbi:SDR family NAD(P)-dependent oxidoreductase [Streptomyces syringium]|uniref:SDR family NAD(P)-dependent oxidoreductase n=1 Tax=Streptomyces syringium TaxID=76729 RepID=UPI0033D8E063